MSCVCLKRDLSLFIKLSSYGAISIITIALFIVSIGFYSISNTNYTAVTFPSQEQLKVSDAEIYTNMRPIFLFNANFSPLAGVLGIGYFLHPVSVPIVRKNLNQKNNERDLTWGYTLVFLSYVLIGVFGYFFKYALSAKDDERPMA